MGYHVAGRVCMGSDPGGVGVLGWWDVSVLISTNMFQLRCEREVCCRISIL